MLLTRFFSLWAVLVLTPLALAGSFDEPLEKKVVDRGPDPRHHDEPGDPPSPHMKLSCYFFPTFMVKEHDSGEKGTDWLSIAPLRPGDARVCEPTHGPGEQMLESSGYFSGVSGDLVFVRDADLFHGGMGFSTFDSTTGKELFHDSAEPLQDPPYFRVDISRDGGRLVLSYRRVVDGN